MRDAVGHADDIAHFDTIIDRLVTHHRADATRVCMMGGSNGGMTASEYAVRRPEKLAAVAPVVGAMFSFQRVPSSPLPIMLINSGADREVPSAGGMSGNPAQRRAQAAPFKPLAETVRFWVRANRWNPTPHTSVRGTVTTMTFPAMPGGAVTLSIVDAVGWHGWPGTSSRRADNVPVQSFPGADMVWSFFTAHARR